MDNRHNQYDVIHLWAKKVYGGDIGLAYLGSVCLQHINCAINGFMWDTLGISPFTIAHELGHNSGTPYDEKTCVWTRNLHNVQRGDFIS